MIGFAACVFAQTEKVSYYYQSMQYQVPLTYGQLVVGYKDALPHLARRNTLAGIAGIKTDSVLQYGLKGRYIIRLNAALQRNAIQRIIDQLKKDVSIAFVRPVIISNAGKVVSYADEF